MDNQKTLSDQLTDVRLDLRELSTKMDGIKDLSKKVDEVHDTARNALQSTQSAHKRIDKIDKIIFWMATSVIGAVIVGIISLAVSGSLKAGGGH